MDIKLSVIYPRDHCEYVLKTVLLSIILIHQSDSDTVSAGFRSAFVRLDIGVNFMSLKSHLRNLCSAYLFNFL